MLDHLVTVWLPAALFHPEKNPDYVWTSIGKKWFDFANKVGP